MKIELSWMLRIGIAVLLSAIFTLYLAPTPEKYEMADMLAVLLLIPVVAKYGTRLSSLVDGIKPPIPLLIFMAYVALQTWTMRDGGDAGLRYVLQLLYGLLPYLLFYLIFRNLVKIQTDILLIAVLVIPGVVHLVYLYLDVFLAIHRGEVAFMTSSKFGFMEYVKNSPRVGRRYVSMALLHLLGGGLLAAWYAKDGPLRHGAWVLSGLSVLSLALLDARAAYASVLIGASLLTWAVGPRQAWCSIKNVFLWHPIWKLVMAGFLVTVAALGYSAGKSRWIAMAYSVEWAVHDVLHTETPLGKRPYVDMTFWSDPIEDVGKCYLTGQFRCQVDQSAYLRTAWALEGAQSLVNHPLGIGYSEDYMGRLWGVEEGTSSYQRVDSFLVEHTVSFGWPVIILYGWFFWGIIHAMRRAARTGQVSVASIMVCAILLACVGRTLVDVFSEGLWKYLMALMGIYYGLLHANGLQPKKG